LSTPESTGPEPAIVLAEQPEGQEAESRRAFAGGTRMFGFRIVQYLIGLGTSVIIARALGVELRGQYALALNLAMIVWVVSQLSIDSAVARLLARREATFQQLSRLGVSAAIALGGVGSLITVAVGITFRDELVGGASDATLILAAASIGPGLASLYFSILLLRTGAIRPYGHVLISTALVQAALIAAVWALDGLSPESVLACALATNCAATTGFGALIARQAGGWRSLAPSFDPSLVRQALSAGIRFHPNLIATYLLIKIDLLLVGAMTDVRAAGLYSLAASIAEPLMLAMRSISVGTLEYQTRASEPDAARFTMDFIRQSLALTLLIGIVVAAFAYPGIIIAYGPEWAGAVLPFVILVGALVFFAPRGAADDLLTRIAPPLWLSAIGAGALLLNLALNLVLIPALGISGAALASLVAYAVAGAASILLLSRVTRLPVRIALALPKQGDLVLELPGMIRGRLSRSSPPPDGSILEPSRSTDDG